MPEIEKDLQYFKEEVAKEHNYNSFEHLRRLCVITTPKYFYDLESTALGRFHAYQISQLKEQLEKVHGQNEVLVLQAYDLKEQLVQKDKETESLKKLALNWASTAEEQKATIERLTKELRETKEQLNSAEEYINTHG